MEKEDTGLSEEELTDILSEPETQEHLFGVAFRILRNHEDAKDAVQDALERSFRYSAKFRYESHPTTWLHAIVRNTALTRLNRRQHNSVLSLDDENIGEISTDAYENPEEQAVEQLYADNLVDRIRKNLDKLSPELKAALLLAAGGLAHKIIADKLGTSEAAAKVRVHRARRKLKQLMEED